MFRVYISQTEGPSSPDDEEAAELTSFSFWVPS